MNRLILTAGVSMIVAAASADLYWYGDKNTTWDTSTKNWRVVGTDAESAFSEGANVLIDPTKFAPGAARTIHVAAKVNPGAIVFDVPAGQAVTNTFGNGCYYNENTKSLAKRGAGTLTINANGSGYSTYFCTGTNDVYAGTVQVIGANKVNAIGHTVAQPSQWVIHDGATLQVGSRNCLGNNNMGSSVRLRVLAGGSYQIGPELENTAYQIGNLINELWLDGGQVNIRQRGDGDAGSIGVQNLLKVSGTTAQQLKNQNGVSSTGIFFGYGANVNVNPRCVIDVADTGNGDTPDLDIALPVARGADPGWKTNRMGFVKTGPGVLRFSADLTGANDRHNLNGDMDILAGEVQFTGSYSLTSAWTNRIYVSTNAVFAQANSRKACTYDHTVGGKAQNSIVIDHGTLVLDNLVNPEDKTNSLAGGYMYLGKSITFDDGVFDQRVIGMGDGALSIPLLTAGELFHVKGARHFDFTPPVLPKQRMALNWPQTEFRIDKTVADASAADMTCGYRLDDWFYYNGGVANAVLKPSGFLKTGAGTLVLTNNASRFSGDVEIREGRVVLKTAGYTSKLFGKASISSFLGCHTNEIAELLVTTNGTLEFCERSMFDIYTYGHDGGNKTKRTVHLNGGTLVLTGNAAQHFGPMRVENGATIDYTKLTSGSTSFDFHGDFRVTGNRPFTLAAAPNAGYSNILQLYPDYQCAFDVEDVTGDLEPDFISYLIPAQPTDDHYYDGADASRGKDAKDGHWWYGFVKKGAGTMALMQSHGVKRFDLPAIVSNGTMLVNADFSNSAGFRLCTGARIGGNGKVSALEMEDGSGFQADPAAAPLTVTATAVTLPASGSVVLKLPADTVDPRNVRSFCTIRAEKGIANPAAAAGWTVTVPGHPELSDAFKLTADGQDVRVVHNSGLVLLFR